MMLSSNRILKSEMVNLDTENKIIIDIGVPALPPDTPVTEDPEKREKDAKKSAANMIRRAEQQAEEIINNALREAEEKQAEILMNAEAEAEKSRAVSRDDGFSEGMAAANSMGEKIKAEAAQILEGAKSERKTMQENLEPEIVNMIIAITEKLLGNTVGIKPAVVVNLIKQGFAQATISGKVTVYVSADDYDEVVGKKEELMALTDGSVKLEITKDLSLSPMDCVIETPFGDIDCSLGQQFEALRTNLTYILNNK
ncbi:MAG: FliH/SctL family protein [Defluviitaleaceae bacterium]|nr:FliH/SctL family protein [Defluviitaleaceae bacterium]